MVPNPRRLENVWNNIYMGKNDMVLGEHLVMSKCNRWPQFEEKKKALNFTTWRVNKYFYEKKLFLC
jgi:hypothetical protein